jgi:GT2 family glycosyltransferase
MTAIIILNWHGADDTLACLDSLAKAEGDFRVYVVDNGSTDDSLSRIQGWIDEHDGVDVRLVPLDKNYGFARGNNKGLEIARLDNPDSYLLLNNDTEVCPDFLTALHEFSALNPKYRVLTPQINYFFDKHKVWNCGGKLRLGFRKYYYAGQADSMIKEKEYMPISFVTGCALFFYPELLDSEGRLLTERFFFGEEDFEFSMRMKTAHVPMACVLNSLIYHKVGASGDKMLRSGKVYLHYLNRFIDIRMHKSMLFYLCWVAVNIPFCLLRFYKHSPSVLSALRLMYQLLKDAEDKEEVTREDFEALVIRNDYF